MKFSGVDSPADAIGCAVNVARVATGEMEDTRYASQNGRKGGLAGAEARTKKLDANVRSEIATKAAGVRWKQMEGIMTQNIENATRDLFANGERQTRGIKYFFRSGNNTADQLADYRNRAIAQINAGLSVEDTDLDRSILD